MSEKSALKIREDMPLDKAAVVSCAVITGVGAVLNGAKSRPGESIAIFGAGGIGLNAVQGALLAGAADAATADAALDFYFNDPTGGFATTIYQGGAGNAPMTEIAPGVRISASVKADNQAIKDVMRGFAVLANFDQMPGGSAAERQAAMVSAAELVIDAEGDLVNIRAAIGVAEQRISGSKSRYEAEETVLTNVYNQKTAKDEFEAASALTALETQLEASYIMTARLSQLNLANFLR